MIPLSTCNDLEAFADLAERLSKDTSLSKALRTRLIKIAEDTAAIADDARGGE